LWTSAGITEGLLHVASESDVAAAGEGLERKVVGVCRDFTNTATVICPNGKLVPGAQVRAFDAGWFWIWQSNRQIGCAVTDANGFFQINFRWAGRFWRNACHAGGRWFEPHSRQTPGIKVMTEARDCLSPGPRSPHCSLAS
jgi:hypothetical protein